MNYQTLENALATLSATPPATLFAYIGALLISAFAMYFYQLRRDTKRRAALEDTVKLRAMSRLVSAQQQEMDLLRERLGTLEAYVDRLNTRQQRLAENAQHRKQRVDDAISIVRRGANQNDLASRAGVSPSEANLIASLYSQ